MKQEDIYNEKEMQIMQNCTLCPRECMADRYKGATGYCNTDATLNIASVCIHRGEEPAISGNFGICNIFFAGCNLRCVYCQNHEISRAGYKVSDSIQSMTILLEKISGFIEEGITSVGFVSPSHLVPHVKAIINALHSRGLKPTTVYNTNSYEKTETIKSLSGYIDVYLPDYKYVTPELAAAYSDASDYPSVALKVLREMYYQKGSALRMDDNGKAEHGMLIRHLVLPGHAEESKLVLRSIAEELSPGVHVSLMSQYHPTLHVKNHPVLYRTLYKEEYESVVREMESLGFRNGWIQDLDSYRNYLPDFSREHPFE